MALRANGPARLFLGVLVFLMMTGMMSGCATHKVPEKKAPRPGAHTKSAIKKAGGYYRVRKGDSLYSIAWRAGLDYHTLARWNGLKSPYTIYPGQRIRLSPPKAGKTPPAVKGTTSGKPVSPDKSVVNKSGKSGSAPSATNSSGKKPGKVATGSLHWQWPVRGQILSHFASNDSARGGIRIGGRKGQKIVAAEAGQVVYVGSGLIGYGQLIIIKHNNKYLSAYGHNSRLRVKEGERVSRGQHISDMGVTNQGAPLLYFEIRRYGKPVDPLKYLPR